MTLAKLEVGRVKEHWNLIKPMVKRANDKTFLEYTEEDIFLMLMQRELDCWVVFEGNNLQAFMTTRVMEYPNETILEIYQMASDIPFEEVRGHIETIADWGKDNGCTRMTAHGRKGWSKLLPNWETKYVMMSRRL